MSDHPILMSGEMVRATLEDLKTMTRRVVRNPERLEGLMLKGEEPDWCPYGVPGDRLWVRETHAILWARVFEPVFRPKEHDFQAGHYILAYRADGATSTGFPLNGEHRWRPSIHMPKWACRLRLEVKDVRVERVQDITTEGIWAEGIQIPVSDGGVLWRMAPSNPAGNVPASYLTPGRLHPDQPPVTTDEVARAHFADLWDKLNSHRGYTWESNPWVWVIKYERVGP